MCFTLWQNFNAIGITLTIEQAINDDFVCRNLAFNAAGYANNQGMVADYFPFNVTIYLNITV